MAWAEVRDREDTSIVFGWLPLPPGVERLWPGSAVRYVAHHRLPSPLPWFHLPDAPTRTAYQPIILALISYVRLDATGAPLAVGLALEAARADLDTLRQVPTFREHPEHRLHSRH